MARQKKTGGGRVTTPRPTRDVHDEILPLRRRNPLMFWFVIVAVAAMVLTTMSGLLAML